MEEKDKIIHDNQNNIENVQNVNSTDGWSSWFSNAIQYSMSSYETLKPVIKNMEKKTNKFSMNIKNNYKNL